MRYIDVCSGISAPTMAWKPLGWEALCFAEIEAAPRAILAHHYPDVPLNGDFTKIEGNEYGPVDLLVGGTPCQSFSIAGLRGGIHDGRGNLALEFLRLLARTGARWFVWENVTGVFSATSHNAPDPVPPPPPMDLECDGAEVETEDEYTSEELHAFNCFLAGVAELGYGIAYRVLDAQYAGVPQRRRRVFAVGYLGDVRLAAAVLFERHSLSGNPAPRREKGPRVAALTANGVGTCGADDNQAQAGHLIPQGFGGDTTPTLNAAFGSKLGLDNQHIDSGAGLFVAHSLRAEGLDASEDGTGRGTPLVPVAFDCKASGQNGFGVGEVMSTLRSMGHKNSHTNGGGHASVQLGSAVRRLTPRECERLQGFPDDFTLVPYRGRMMADGPRYKALGNSMAVPVLRWIGERIAKVDALQTQAVAA